jgi:hypothetical protein
LLMCRCCVARNFDTIYLVALRAVSMPATGHFD